VPARLWLAADVPSSAGGRTSIRYAIPGTSLAHVRLSVYDAAGRLVRALVDGPEAPGTHVLVWDGRAANGARAGSGVFFCRITCNGETRTRNLVLVR
jgi:flagellar hook assembly protein FlgD